MQQQGTPLAALPPRRPSKVRPTALVSATTAAPAGNSVQYFFNYL